MAVITLIQVESTLQFGVNVANSTFEEHQLGFFNSTGNCSWPGREHLGESRDRKCASASLTFVVAGNGDEFHLGLGPKRGDTTKPGTSIEGMVRDN